MYLLENNQVQQFAKIYGLEFIMYAHTQFVKTYIIYTYIHIYTYILFFKMLNPLFNVKELQKRKVDHYLK